MNADFLKINLHFKEGIKGAYYKKIDGFLYTVDPNDGTEIFFYVNLPKVDEEEKHIFINFLKDNLKNFIKARIVKNGIKITLTADAFSKKNFIVKAAQQISEYLKSRDISFENEKPPIDYKNNMYVFLEETADEIEPIIDEPQKNPEETEEKKNCFFKNILSFLKRTQIFLITIYLLCAIVFILLSFLSINIAAVSGYFMGWLPAEILSKRGYKNKKVFLFVTLFSLITLIFSGVAVFLLKFLSQNLIYTAAEFMIQSLIPAYCGFNIILGLLLSMFGTYSTLPAGKKKDKQKENNEDFE